MTVTEGSDSVYIKTYHASKGLEYPFVFLCQLDIPLIKKDKGYCSHNKLGFAFSFMDNSKLMRKTSLYYDKLSKESKAEEKVKTPPALCWVHKSKRKTFCKLCTDYLQQYHI